MVKCQSEMTQNQTRSFSERTSPFDLVIHGSFASSY